MAHDFERKNVISMDEVASLCESQISAVTGKAVTVDPVSCTLTRTDSGMAVEIMTQDGRQWMAHMDGRNVSIVLYPRKGVWS